MLPHILMSAFKINCQWVTTAISQTNSAAKSPLSCTTERICSGPEFQQPLKSWMEAGSEDIKQCCCEYKVAHSSLSGRSDGKMSSHWPGADRVLLELGPMELLQLEALTAKNHSLTYGHAKERALTARSSYSSTIEKRRHTVFLPGPRSTGQHVQELN